MGKTSLPGKRRIREIYDLRAILNAVWKRLTFRVSGSGAEHLTITQTGGTVDVVFDTEGLGGDPGTIEIADVDGLGDALTALGDEIDGKAATSHTHATSDVTGLDSALADIDGDLGTLASAIAGKANASHTHATSEVTGLDAALAGKAATSHSHATSDVTGLDAALAGKAAASHAHATSDVTGLDAALAGKAATSHTHATSDVTGLDAALAGKAAASHGHNASDINAGTLDAARLPVAGTSTIGGLKRNTGSAGEFVTGVASDGSLERGIPGDSVAAFVPIGMVVPYAGWNVLPDNYLFCDGTIYDVNDPDYSNLGWVLGGNYGMGSNKGTTLSITNGSTIITASGAHGLSVGDTIFSIVWKQMTSSGFMALDGLQSFDAYACEVLTVPSSTTFTIATVRGSGVAKSSSQTLSGITWRDEFAVPDLRGRVPAGRDDLGGSAASRLSSAGFGGVATAVGRSGGSETHQLVEAEIPTFTKYSSHSTASNTATTGGAARVGVLNTVSYGGGGAHKNVQPTLTINYLIRYS